jgi:protein-S-isoprenylcysteine O-methyltransferase Ste14
MSTFASRLARLRVPLGFVTSAAALLLAHPTIESLVLGFAIAVAGEAIRIWAAGHLEKSKEVTRSGPYRFTRHPLYVGSTIMAIGIVIATRSTAVFVLAAVYMAATLTAAIRTEEAFLRQAFGAAYDEYRAARGVAMDRRFSFARAMRNREYRAVAGLIAGFALLALKMSVSL